jgi:ribose transport system substrate-binding protein
MQKNYIYITVIVFLSVILFSGALLAKGLDLGDSYPYATVGPQGETATNYDEVNLSDAEKEAVRSGNYKAAICLHETSVWTKAVTNGLKDMFKDVGIKVVAVTDAEMDPQKQRTDIESVLALQPDILVTLVIDPVSGAAALQQAIDQGVNVVLISNLPAGFVHGRDYVSIVTDDLFQMGKSVADMIGKFLGGKGKVALLYHDANYYVTNQRDRAVKAILQRDYPGIEIIAERGIADPNDGNVVASAILTQYPDVDAIYAPWDTIAEGVVAAARANARDDVKVFTIDLGTSNAMDMVKDGNMKGIVADLPYVLGETLGKIGILSVLGKETPAFVTVPAVKIDKNNINTMWEKVMNEPLPEDISRIINK